MRLVLSEILFYFEQSFDDHEVCFNEFLFGQLINRTPVLRKTQVNKLTQRFFDQTRALAITNLWALDLLFLLQ